MGRNSVRTLPPGQFSSVQFSSVRFSIGSVFNRFSFHGSVFAVFVGSVQFPCISEVFFSGSHPKGNVLLILLMVFAACMR